MEKRDERGVAAAKIAAFFAFSALGFCLAWAVAKHVLGFDWKAVAPLMGAQMFCMGLYIGWGPLSVLRNHWRGGE